MKKIALILVLAALALLLASCGGNGNVGDDSTSSDNNMTSDNTNNTNNGDTSNGGNTGGDTANGSNDTSGDGITDNNSGNNGDIAGNVSSTDSLDSVMGYILDGVAIDYATINDAITQEQFEFNFFIPYIEGSEAYTSLALIGSIPHCVNLLRVPDGTDAATVASDIETNINPRKWICVEAEATAVKRCGNLILVIMSDKDIVDGVSANFDNITE